MDGKRLGRRIRAFRKLKGHTQVSLANALEIPIITLGNVERGKQQANDEMLDAIAEKLNISKHELILSDEQKEH
ncbi:helix-turn-helix domain-containing protein [Virgibacillus siamensis]|uniref:helix-turn-helix domain-containing protein n=1 Tax=Virgibacillus siamensis TaxID=480071 RepID=UPI000984E6D6|nr:helix-turn-helix transcriptional regulator [Virgibacillus siamensis]